MQFLYNYQERSVAIHAPILKEKKKSGQEVLLNFYICESLASLYRFALHIKFLRHGHMRTGNQMCSLLFALVGPNLVKAEYLRLSKRWPVSNETADKRAW